MSAANTLKALFFAIFAALFLGTGWAALHQPVWLWGGLTTGDDRYWTVATLMDAYGGFLTFYAWVFYKEVRWPMKVLWFVAIMLLGNMAMSTYMLIQLFRLREGQPVSSILARTS
jgi:Protein of unknown function (DUF1475)